MSEKSPARQLDMSFEGDSRLAARLRDGDFFLLVEWNTPSREQPFDSALAMGEALAKKIRTTADVAGLAVTDRLRGEDCHDPVDVATRLMTAGGKPVLLHLSGKGSDEERIKDLLARGRSAGIRSFLALTGDRSPGHALSPRGRPTGAPPYLDSIDILRLARRMSPDFHLGAGVNPFKYNLADQRLQMFKMIRKLNSGAQFLVTQIGWDMKKFQELQWTLQMRELGQSVIARVVLLSLDDIRAIGDFFLPGVPVPRAFAAALQRESNLNAQQSLAAQLRRIGLQIAGCRLLGFNGVQIAGIRDARLLDMVLRSVRECLKKYSDYDRWLQAWNEFHASLSFAPVPDAFYAYRHLLEAGRRVYDPEACPMADGVLPDPGPADRLRSRAVPFMVSSRRPAWLALPARRLLGLDSGALRGLDFCYGLNNAACPKRLFYGPCGGSAPDGICEFGRGTCFFHRVLALAGERRELDRLEAGVEP